MSKRTIHDDVQAALKRLDAEDPGLKRELKKAHGYAVFPAVGKAALVLGGAYGRGEVYERGKPIGYATIAQTTIGVQIGGETFTEVLVFKDKDSLERFKRGRTAFAANAAAVLVKAGAAGTADFEKGVAAYAYSEGGMLLEAAIGGQRFHFQSAEGVEAADSGGDSEEAEESSEQSGSVANKAGGLIKDHPVWTALIGTGLVAGAGWLMMSAMRGDSSDAEDRDESEDESEGEDEGEEDDTEAEDQAQDRDEESDEQDQDEGDEEDEEEEEESPRFSRSRH